MGGDLGASRRLLRTETDRKNDETRALFHHTDILRNGAPYQKNSLLYFASRIKYVEVQVKGRQVIPILLVDDPHNIGNGMICYDSDYHR